MGDDECNESSSVATTSTTPSNWWDINHIHHHHHQPYNNINNNINNHNWLLNQNPNSSTNHHHHQQHVSTHDHSGFPLQSSNQLPSDNHIWTQLLLNIGNGVELQSNEQDIGANFLDTISSKSMSNAGIFEPTACSDYLKKMDNDNNNNWDTFQIFNNNNNGLITTNTHMLENDRLLKLSNLVNTWSIALPSTETHMRHLMDEEHDHLQGMTEANHGGLEPDATMAQAGLESGGSALFRRECYNDNASTRNIGDYISFNGRLGKPVVGINASSNHCFKSLNLPADNKKQIHPNSSPTRISGGAGISSGVSSTDQGKKKRSEDSSETSIKKSKQDNSTHHASTKILQQPKVKIGDRITALQQIVSPFGKTDTASVLTETIGYIKFLQEQVQLLSNPYMKTNSYKDTWERKEVKLGDGKNIDLRSRGLCLVPISCTPQVYRDNTGSDYWTPYRGCFYR